MLVLWIKLSASFRSERTERGKVHLRSRLSGALVFSELFPNSYLRIKVEYDGRGVWTKALRLFVFVLVGLFALGLCVAFGVAAVSAVGASPAGDSPAPSQTASYSYNLTAFGRVYEVKASTNSSCPISVGLQTG